MINLVTSILSFFLEQKYLIFLHVFVYLSNKLAHPLVSGTQNSNVYFYTTSFFHHSYI